MKKAFRLTSIVLSLTLILVLFSGSSGEFDKTVIIHTRDLPKKIQTFIENNFKDYVFLRAVEDGSYSVMFKGNVRISFTRDGDWTYVSGGGDKIPTTFIDEKIVSVVEAKYPNDPITVIEKTKKYYNIKLKNDTKLKIDMEGNILKEKVK